MRKILKTIFRPLAKIFYRTTWIYRIYHSLMAYMVAARYGFPGRQLITVGVTGTNGKSTTTYLTAQILKAAGHSVGMVTTVSFWVGESELGNDTKLTSLGPEAIQPLLAQMVKAGNKFLAIEVSSHSVKQNRIAGITFTGAALTNITHDHLDYHHNFEEYVSYKEKLFRHLSPRGGYPSVIAVNGKDPYADRFLNNTANKKIRYNDPTSKHTALWADNVESNDSGSSFDLIFPDNQKLKVILPIPGDFNVENALAAASLAFGLGVSPEIIQGALNSARPVPGRMEKISVGQPFNVIIDYAHTPDGYARALSDAKRWTTGKLIVVFGAAGDRDKFKRPILGEVASRFADHIILTEEDPGSENAETIINEIRPGIDPRFQVDTNLDIILDRPAAIEHAIKLARPGDTVMLLSMGAQTVMAKGGQLIPYNEREIVKSLLQSIIR